jgi:prevent-host-death family protein
MPLSISEDIKTVSDLKRNTNEIFKHMHDSGRPVVVTVNGKPDAILMDVNVFEKKLKALNLGLLLSPAEKDIKGGRTKNARTFLKELKKSAKISS